MLVNEELAMLLGAITAEASRLETQLAKYFAMLVCGYRRLPDAGENIAAETMESLKSTKQKCETIMLAARHRLDNVQCKILQKKIRAVQDAMERRSKVVHARWAGGSEGQQRKLVKYNRLGNPKAPEEWTRDDFLSILQALNKADAELAIFFHKEILPRLEAETKVYIKNLSAMYEVDRDG